MTKNILLSHVWARFFLLGGTERFGAVVSDGFAVAVCRAGRRNGRRRGSVRGEGRLVVLGGIAIKNTS